MADAATALLIDRFREDRAIRDRILAKMEELAPLGQTGARLDEVSAKLDELLALARDNHQRINSMAKEMDDLVREVAETRAGVDSAVTLIQGLRQQLADAGTDPAKLAELAASLDAAQTQLAQAVATPGPNPAPPPAPTV